MFYVVDSKLTCFELTIERLLEHRIGTKRSKAFLACNSQIATYLSKTTKRINF